MEPGFRIQIVLLQRPGLRTPRNKIPGFLIPQAQIFRIMEWADQLLLITSTPRQWPAFRSPKLKLIFHLKQTIQNYEASMIKCNFLILWCITLFSSSKPETSIICRHQTLLTCNQCEVAPM